MYPQMIKNLVEKKDITSLEKLIDSQQGEDPIARYWGMIGKADLIRKYGNSKDEFIVAYLLYNEVIEAKLSNGKPLPDELNQWAVFGIASFMLNVKYYLPAEVEGNRDMALAYVNGILEKPADNLIKQECLLLLAKITIAGTAEVPCDFEKGITLLNHIHANPVNKDLEKEALKQINIFKRIAMAKKKNDDFMVKFASPISALTRKPSTPAQANITNTTSTAKGTEKNNAPSRISKKRKIRDESVDNDGKKTSQGKKLPSISEVTNNNNSLDLPPIMNPSIIGPTPQSQAPTQFFQQPGNQQRTNAQMDDFISFIDEELENLNKTQKQ